MKKPSELRDKGKRASSLGDEKGKPAIENFGSFPKTLEIVLQRAML